MPLDLARVQAICFDVDGTLSDTDDQWISTMERRLQPFRRLFPGERIRPFIRWAIMSAETPANLMYHLLDRAGLDDEVGRFYSHISQRRIGYHPRSFWLVQGAREMLSRVSQRYPLAVVSARDQASTQAFLQQFELNHLFTAVATALTCQYTKPFADPIRWAALQMGVSPENCLMVGDTPVDIHSGKAAGAQTVGVLCGFGRERELLKAGANLILPHTAALVEVLCDSRS